ncbi:MAG: aminotransferase class V-fold PLP-dependent enzyme [Chlamydiota bacterium]
MSAVLDKKKVLDVEFCREQFPAFHDPSAREWLFFENAGGSYVANPVIERYNKYLISHRVQPGSYHALSTAATSAVDEAYALFSEVINAKKQEIIFNISTSMNFYVLANAFRKELKLGDEIIVTNQDHESNIGFWRRLADMGVVVREWGVSSETGLLLVDDLKKLLNKNTRFVFCSHCSNVVADIQDIKTIGEHVHNVKAMLIVDGVSYAPHGSLDMNDLNVDFYSYSIYKTYGPHLALMYGKQEHLERLSNEGHYFNQHILRKKWSPAGPPYEQIAAAVGVVDYYLRVYAHHFGKNEECLHNKVKKVHDLFHMHEINLCNPILEYLRKHPKIRILGAEEMIPHKRGPNLAFTHAELSSKAIVEALAKKKIAATNYHFYARRLIEAVGISNPNDGAVRLSLVHYNTLDEVHKFLEVCEEIL